MADKNISQLLAEIVSLRARNGPLPSFGQVQGLSQAILSGVGPQEPYTTQTVSQEDPRGPSFVNRILDLMSRPLYATLNPIKGVIEDIKNKDLQPVRPEMFTDIWKGLSGQEKTTGRDILEVTGLNEAMGDSPAGKFGQFAAGLGIDIAADPLTYVGVGLIPKIGRAAKLSTEGLSAIESGTGRAAQDISSEIARRAALQAQQVKQSDTIIPKAGMAAPPVNAPPRTFIADAGLPKQVEQILPLPVSRGLALPPGPSSTITPPLPKPLEPVELLKETLTRSAQSKPELQQLLPKFLDDINQVTAMKILSSGISSTKSPVIQSILRKQLDKLKVNVRPADLLSEARVSPPEFPAVTINKRWQDVALQQANKFLTVNRLNNVNHIGQSNLYNRIVNSARKVRVDRRPAYVLQMLRIAEDKILESGRHLVDAEGISVRLSDLANISGGAKALTPKLVEEFRKARPSQQIEDLKAHTTPAVASQILDPVIQTGAQIAQATSHLPPSQTVLMGSNLSKELAKIAENAGASSREARTAKTFIDDLFNPSRDKLYSTIQQEARALVRQSSTGVVEPAVLHKITNSTYDVLGSNPKILGRQIEQNKVTEGIMTKFATWWGAKDIKPFAREYIDTARNVAAAFVESVTPLVRSTKPSQRTNAWRIAQGKITAHSPEDQQLADQFKYLVERLMGTHGIKENAEAVVLRSGTLMKELNDELPKSLQFIDKAGTDKIGKSFNYKDGNWMHSWKEWEGEEPAEILYQLTRALQFVTRKNAMWDDAAARWGMPVKGAEFQHQTTNIDRLNGTYFPQQIATQLTNLKKQMDRDIFKTPHKAIALFDKVQRMWKTGVTVYSPSHHIRNLNGDIYLSALDGVVTPGPYALAAKVLRAYPTRYTDLESVFKIMDPKLRNDALRARPGNIAVTTGRGDKLTTEQIYQAAEQQGLFIRMMHIEDIVGDTSPVFGSLGNRFQPFGGRVYQAAGKVTELRDHWVRLAHFIDVLKKSNAPLKTAIEQAGRRVKKFHPDGTDLTGFEQNVLRRVIPFYSWMRKATPLVIEGAVMRPHITLAFPKVMANAQLLTGVESEGPGDPFPMDQMFPEWLKEKGIGPLLHPGNDIGRHNSWRGESPGYTIINPTQPFIDQIMQIGHPQQTAISSLTPFARVPIELLTQQTSLGIPLEHVEGGTAGHLAQQIPAVGIGARLTGLTRPNEPYHPEQLINWLLTGGLVTGTGPYESQARMEIREYLNKIAAENRGNYR